MIYLLLIDILDVVLANPISTPSDNGMNISHFSIDSLEISNQTAISWTSDNVGIGSSTSNSIGRIVSDTNGPTWAPFDQKSKEANDGAAYDLTTEAGFFTDTANAENTDLSTGPEENAPFSGLLRTKTGKKIAAVAGYREEWSNYPRLQESYDKTRNTKEARMFVVPEPGGNQYKDEWGEDSRFRDYAFERSDAHHKDRSGFDQYRRPSYDKDLDLSILDYDYPISPPPMQEIDEPAVAEETKRANPGLFLNSACAMWLGPAQSPSCCVGQWYDWPTCFCTGYISCDDTVVF